MRFIVIIIICMAFQATVIFAQDSSFEDYEDLFLDQERDRVNRDDSVSSGSSDYSSDSFEEKDQLIIEGDHSVFLPVPINPDHFDYLLSPRLPRVLNSISLDYDTEHIRFKFNVNANYWATQDLNFVESLQSHLGESYISYYNNYINAKLGLINYEWGSGLGFNPTDKLNSVNYRYGMMSKRIPTLSASLTVNPLPFWSLEAIYVPLFQKDLYPVDLVSAFKSNIEDRLKSLSSPIPVSAQVTENMLDFDPSQFQAAVRSAFYLPALDIYISYIYDIDSHYSLDEYSQQTILNNMIPTESLFSYTLVRRRIQRIGLDIMTTLGRSTVWVESMANLTEDIYAEYSTIRNPNIEWSMGANFNFAKDDAGSIGIQQVGKYVFDYNREIQGFSGPTDFQNTEIWESQKEYQNSILGQEREALRVGLMLNANYGFLDKKITTGVDGGYFLPLYYEESSNFRPGGFMARPYFEFNPVDAFYITLGSQLSFAWVLEDDGAWTLDEADLLGQSAQSNLVFIEFTYKWRRGGV